MLRLFTHYITHYITHRFAKVNVGSSAEDDVTVQEDVGRVPELGYGNEARLGGSDVTLPVAHERVVFVEDLLVRIRASKITVQEMRPDSRNLA